MKISKVAGAILVSNLLLLTAPSVLAHLEHGPKSSSCSKKILKLVNEGAKLSLKNSEAALSKLNQAVEMAPDCNYALVQRVYVLRNLGKEAAAHEDLEKLIELSGAGTDAQKHATIAFKYMVYNDFKAAKQELDKAIELDANEMYFYPARASVLMQLDMHPHAFSDLNNAARLKPKDPRPYFGLASAYTKLGLHKDALREYQRAVRLLAIQSSREE